MGCGASSKPAPVEDHNAPLDSEGEEDSLPVQSKEQADAAGRLDVLTLGAKHGNVLSLYQFGRTLGAPYLWVP